MSEGRVERMVRERQLLCRRLLHADFRIARSSGSDELLGGIDGRHRRWPHPFDQLGRECARTAADVEHSLTSAHPGEVGKLR